MEENKENRLIYFINFTACVVGTGLILAFALGMEKHGSWANDLLAFLLGHKGAVIAILSVIFIISCLLFLRKG